MSAQPAANMQKYMATNLYRLQKVVWRTLRRVGMRCLAAADLEMFARRRNCASTHNLHF
jgi:hypothetical protein